MTLKYPSNVTSSKAMELMMRLEGLEQIANGDAWFTIDLYNQPLLQGFIQKTEEDEQEEIFYLFECIEPGGPGGAADKWGWAKEYRGALFL